MVTLHTSGWMGFRWARTKVAAVRIARDHVNTRVGSGVISPCATDRMRWGGAPAREVRVTADVKFEVYR